VLLRNGSAYSSLVVQFVGYLALAGVGGCGLAWALRDRKSTLTFLAGGLLLRSAISVLAMLFMGQSTMLLVEWLLVGMAGAGVLWQVWKTGPREAGDVMAVLAYRFTC